MHDKLALQIYIELSQEIRPRIQMVGEERPRSGKFAEIVIIFSFTIVVTKKPTKIGLK